MDKIIEWVLANAFNQGRLAVLLVLLGIAIFIGLVPSPMLLAVQQVSQEHRVMEILSRQICVNTSIMAKTPIEGCFQQKTQP